jgi:hypothetical protein
LKKQSQFRDGATVMVRDAFTVALYGMVLGWMGYVVEFNGKD